jgi:hypothetical protein
MSDDIKVVTLYNLNDLTALGEWLDEMMPNPPLPEPQRWTFKNATTLIESEFGIKFMPNTIEFIDDNDVFMFKLVWNQNVSN